MVPMIHLDFELRRDYISEVLCINQDKPITVCGGQCYLGEQLQKVEVHQEKEAEVPGRSVEISFFNQEIAELDFGICHVLANGKIRSPHNPGFTQTIVEDIFKPPRFS